MNTGWIGLHRKLLDWEWYKDANVSRLFIHLLLKANHKPNKWQGIKINRGQLITGRKTLSEELSLSEMQIRTALNKLKSTNEITIKTTNQYSVVTINNYSLYQRNNHPANQRITNEQPTDNQRITTNNNDNNVKNEKNIHIQASKVLEIYNRLYEREITSTRGFESNLAYWLEEYSLKDIEDALKAGLRDNYWKDILDPVILLRQKNQQGENVDYIGSLKNRAKVNQPQRELRADEAYGPDGKIRRIGGDSK